MLVQMRSNRQLHGVRKDWLNAWMLAASFAAIGLLLAVIGGALLYRSRLSYQINYNEGWNSYFVDRVLQGLPLYPDRATRLVNNYPPLSFYIVAAVAKLTGAVLVAGRAVAWFSFFGCASLIGMILRRMACSAAGALYGAVFFAAVIATRCDLYVGMFDPQLLGQLFMLSGLLALLGARGRSAPSRGGAAGAAVLMVAGGFVKHSLIALPVSVALWLAWCHRTLFWAWLMAGVAAAGVGLAACMAAFGPEFVAGLLVPRHFDVAAGLRKVLRWLLPIELPCILATLPLALGGDHARLVGIYLVVALGAGVLGASPAATNYNMIFELLVAVSLGLGLLIGSRPIAARIPSGWVALAGAACLWITAVELATAETSNWRVWSAQQNDRAVRRPAAVFPGRQAVRLRSAELRAGARRGPGQPAAGHRRPAVRGDPGQPHQRLPVAGHAPGDQGALHSAAGLRRAADAVALGSRWAILGPRWGERN